MDIAAFRQQYPQYDEIDDATLADRLYAKHYDGKIDRAEFDTSFLGTPAKKPGIVSRLTPDFIENPIKQAAGAVADAVQGDAEFPDLPAIHQTGRKSLRGGVALAFGNDEDGAAAWLRDHPDLELSEDSNGNILFRDQQGEPVAYANTPGLTGADAGRLFSKAAAFLPAGRAASVAATGAKVGGRTVAAGGTGAGVAVGGLASAGTDAALQKVSGREEIDKGQVALTGVLGAGSEALAPAVGKALQAVKNRFGPGRFEKLSPERQKEAIRAQLQKDGFTPEEFAGIDRQQGVEFGRARLRDGDAVTPDVRLATDEFGFRATRGQALPARNKAEEALQHKQLNQEEFLRTQDGAGAATLREIDRGNVDRIESVVDEIADEFAGGAPRAGSRNEGAARASTGLKEAAAASEKRFREAYDRASEHDGEVANFVVTELPGRIRASLDKAGVFLDDADAALGSLTPRTQKVLSEFEANPQTGWKAIENQRKKINGLLDGAKRSSPEDFRALTIAKKEFDDSIAEAFDNGVFFGSPEALQAMKEARGLYSEHARKYAGREGPGKIVSRIVDEDLDPEEVASALFGASGFGKQNAARTARAYAEAVGGKDTDAFKALKESYLYSIARSQTTTDQKGLKQFSSSLKRALHGSGESLSKELYTPAERAKLLRLSRSLEALAVKPDRANPSGTGAAIARLGNGAFGQVPGVRQLFELIGNVSNAGAAVRAARLPTPAAPPVSATPVAGALVANE